MPDRLDMKMAAKEQIKGNIGILAVLMIISALITGTGIGSIFSPALFSGMCLVYIGLTSGYKPTIMDLFKRINIFGRAFWLAFLTSLFTILWSLLFIVPGIIKGISYSMGLYILAENPDWTARECIKESKRIMKGNIGKFFVLALSFIPWYLLCSVTFGIAIIYVYPYVNATIANFYNSIKDL